MYLLQPIYDGSFAHPFPPVPLCFVLLGSAITATREEGTDRIDHVDPLSDDGKLGEPHNLQTHERYDDEAIIALIFAGFSFVVTSIFIINIQGKLQPDYTPMNYALLPIIAHATLGEVPIAPDTAFPQLTGPDPTIVHQWINLYSRAEMSVSTIDRIRHRQRTMKGMVTWHFDSLMESLPLLLQVALLLLGHALSDYLFTINSVVAGVVVGVLFYLLIRSAATLSYNCPFQVPVSFMIRSMICFDDEH
ncbi:hypothetical protein BJ322DRAFT_1109852 [Thelephora terrestris]|uniref:DUF6535 domain-containing protein n=1 Tax=Thelephora terrestris TaxID=56493 RepID=A0A9P6HC58_9AGAM|nr:hypothetical protein BJ322DRAFT_1109852 [Thelephora terrestris]